ncbi:MAG: hypothetical protein AAFZ18_03580 [Myxococcota bacterium]
MNVFGQQSAMFLMGTPVAMASVDWDSLCALDADGDGASNGAELGDADCSWRSGGPERSAVSNPADANDLPPPSSGVIPPNPAEIVGQGCQTTRSHGSFGALVLLAGMMLWMRRDRGRRRRCAEVEAVER